MGPLGEEHLANREFQLMELFMHNAGTRMPTERLMLEVWGEDAPKVPTWCGSTSHLR
ncbi:MAG: helix-turn-helix domain-containing protein [Collinsella sp.]